MVSPSTAALSHRNPVCAGKPVTAAVFGNTTKVHPVLNFHLFLDLPKCFLPQHGTPKNQRRSNMKKKTTQEHRKKELDVL
jgi:hypothetical protein